MPKQEYIQVGVTAMRDPKTGGFLPAVPLYIRADDTAEAGEQELIADIGKLFAERMRHYQRECAKAGLQV